MNTSELDIIPVFEHLTRQKTHQPYYTFCSHEAAEAINNYLITRKVLVYDVTGKVIGARDVTPEDPLFDVSYQWIGDLFEEINTKLNLGKAGRYNRFTIHMMRRYHATQLYEAGMSEDKINLLQGRTPKSVIHESYIRVKLEDLKEEYIQCLPYIVVSEISKVRTKMDIVVEENENLKTENESLRESILDRIEALEQIRWDDIKK